MFVVFGWWVPRLWAQDMEKTWGFPICKDATYLWFSHVFPCFPMFSLDFAAVMFFFVPLGGTSMDLSSSSSTSPWRPCEMTTGVISEWILWVIPFYCLKHMYLYIYGQSLLKNDVVRMYVAVIYSQGSKFRQWKLRLACSDLGVWLAGFQRACNPLRRRLFPRPLVIATAAVSASRKRRIKPR